VNEAATNISYKIDDMTGDYISVRKWLDDDVSLHKSFHLYTIPAFSKFFYEL